MQLFYLENPQSEIILSAEESKHSIKVLRKKEGDILNFTDGKGMFYKAKIILADSRKCKLQVVSSEQKSKNHDYYLHIAIAPTKNIERFEWFLEKASEIGITEITPLICNRTEKKFINENRFKKILVSSMKQSLKTHLPKLNSVSNLRDFIEIKHDEDLFIAHCNESEKELLIKSINPKSSYLILIGPEGDFTNEEVKKCNNKKFQNVSLGDTRLRAETAGIVACHTISIANM